MKKFTKILSLFLCLVMALGVLIACKSNGDAAQNNANADNNAAQALAGDFYDENGLFYVATEDNTCKVSVGRATGLKEIVIPATYQGYTVTSIAQAGFFGCENLESITIPETVTVIGNLAFQNSTNLAEIKLPENSQLKTIGASAFENTKFYNTEENWENGALYFGKYLIRVKDNVSTCSIKDGIEIIGDYAFYNCTALTKVEIPTSVKYIGILSFANCSEGIDVSIQSLKAWCSIEFANQASNPLAIKSSTLVLNGKDVFNIRFSEEITTISDYAFYGYTKFTMVTFSTAIQKIGDKAFAKASNLGVDIENDDENKNGIKNEIISYRTYFEGDANEWKKVSKGGSGVPEDKNIHYIDTIPYVPQK